MTKSNKEEYQLMENKLNSEKKYLLYINSLGGYIEPGTQMFILDENIYKDKSVYRN